MVETTQLLLESDETKRAEQTQSEELGFFTQGDLGDKHAEK